jgi:nitrite reductase/ring-hydroxylating ferredoxin subunit
LSEGFVKVAESKDIEPSSMKPVDVAGEKVCIINIEGNYYAIGNVCTHVGGPLDEGTLEGYEVECPWHGSKFDVRTGEPTKPPARQAVSKYEVKILSSESFCIIFGELGKRYWFLSCNLFNCRRYF